MPEPLDVLDAPATSARLRRLGQLADHPPAEQVRLAGDRRRRRSRTGAGSAVVLGLGALTVAAVVLLPGVVAAVDSSQVADSTPLPPTTAPPVPGPVAPLVDLPSPAPTDCAGAPELPACRPGEGSETAPTQEAPPPEQEVDVAVPTPAPTDCASAPELPACRDGEGVGG